MIRRIDSIASAAFPLGRRPRAGGAARTAGPILLMTAVLLALVPAPSAFAQRGQGPDDAALGTPIERAWQAARTLHGEVSTNRSATNEERAELIAAVISYTRELAGGVPAGDETAAQVIEWVLDQAEASADTAFIGTVVQSLDRIAAITVEQAPVALHAQFASVVALRQQARFADGEEKSRLYLSVAEKAAAIVAQEGTTEARRGIAWQLRSIAMLQTGQAEELDALFVAAIERHPETSGKAALGIHRVDALVLDRKWDAVREAAQGVLVLLERLNRPVDQVHILSQLGKAHVMEEDDEARTTLIERLGEFGRRGQLAVDQLEVFAATRPGIRARNFFLHTIAEEPLAVELADFLDRHTIIVFWQANNRESVGFVDTIMREISRYPEDGLGVALIATGARTIAAEATQSEVVAARGWERAHVLNDRTGAVARAYGVTAVPTVFFLDPEAEVIFAGQIDRQFSQLIELSYWLERELELGERAITGIADDTGTRESTPSYLLLHEMLRTIGHEESAFVRKATTMARTLDRLAEDDRAVIRGRLLRIMRNPDHADITAARALNRILRAQD